MVRGNATREGASAVRNPTAIRRGAATASAPAESIGAMAAASSADARLRDLALLRR